MVWIKRNLFFVIGGIIALALLGAAGFYGYQALNHNADELGKLHEIYGQLQEINGKTPAPSPENIELARTQEAQVRDWIKQAGTHFQPIPTIPDLGANGVDSELLGATLRNTIAQLQQEAVAANVAIPPKYNFSFEAEAGSHQMIMKFAPASLTMLPVQLGEVKAISEVVFGAHVNAFDSIQRVHVTDDDLGGAVTDYLQQTSVTNSMAVITPYVVTFRCFTPELAGALSGFASSPNGFVVSNISIQRAGNSPTEGMYPGMYPNPGVYAPNLGGPMPVPTVGTPNGLPIILKEQLLRVTLEVKIIKLLSPK